MRYFQFCTGLLWLQEVQAVRNNVHPHLVYRFPKQIDGYSPLRHTTLVIVVDKGWTSALLAAHCTYMATLDPNQVIHISDFKLPSFGGCGFPVKENIQVNPASALYFASPVSLWIPFEFK